MNRATFSWYAKSKLEKIHIVPRVTIRYQDRIFTDHQFDNRADNKKEETPTVISFYFGRPIRPC